MYGYYKRKTSRRQIYKGFFFLGYNAKKKGRKRVRERKARCFTMRKQGSLSLLLFFFLFIFVALLSFFNERISLWMKFIGRFGWVELYWSGVLFFLFFLLRSFVADIPLCCLGYIPFYRFFFLLLFSITQQQQRSKQKAQSGGPFLYL